MYIRCFFTVISTSFDFKDFFFYLYSHCQMCPLTFKQMFNTLFCNRCTLLRCRVRKIDIVLVTIVCIMEGVRLPVTRAFLHENDGISSQKIKGRPNPLMYLWHCKAPLPVFWCKGKNNCVLFFNTLAIAYEYFTWLLVNQNCIPVC